MFGGIRGFVRSGFRRATASLDLAGAIGVTRNMAGNRMGALGAWMGGMSARTIGSTQAGGFLNQGFFSAYDQARRIGAAKAAAGFGSGYNRRMAWRMGATGAAALGLGTAAATHPRDTAVGAGMVGGALAGAAALRTGAGMRLGGMMASRFGFGGAMTAAGLAAGGGAIAGGAGVSALTG